MHSRDSTVDRRRFIKTAAAVGLVGPALAGCSGSSDGDDGGDGTPTETSGGGEPQSFDGFLADTSNYDGVVDETGSSQVTVQVGTEANGGPYGYSPPAIRVSSGTEVVWEWTGNGSHDVVAEDGSFESDLHSEEGTTFSHTFDSSGTTKYACTPHRAMGMRGVVVVE